MAMQYNGIQYSIDEDRDDNGVILYSCKEGTEAYPVYIRTNGVNIFHYKFGEDDEDIEWQCYTTRTELVEEMKNAAGSKDEDESNITKNCWYGTTTALLYYIDWI